METPNRGQLGNTSDGEAAGLVAALLSISKSVRALMGLRLAELGLYSGQDELLLVLKDGSPQKVSQVAEQLNVRPSTVSKMKDRLEERQLLTEAANAIDARNTWIQLTPAGLELAVRVEALHQSIQNELKSAVNGKGNVIETAVMQIEELLTRRLRRLR